MPPLKNWCASRRQMKIRFARNAKAQTPTSRSQQLPAIPLAQAAAAPPRPAPPFPEAAANPGCGAAHKEKYMKIQDDQIRADLFNRLRRIEGQVRGVQTMLENERNCHEIFQQLTAIQSAMRSVSLQLVESSASTCFQQLASTTDSHEREVILQDLLTLVKKAS